MKKILIVAAIILGSIAFSINVLAELNEQQASSEDFVNTVRNEIFSSNNIYVYTPKGDVFELPIGSTPIDFAYSIHQKVSR